MTEDTFETINESFIIIASLIKKSLLLFCSIIMIIFAVIARGSNILAEYGTASQDLIQNITTIIGKNSSTGTRLVPIGKNLCAVMNKTINKEQIVFAAVIESNEERDNTFNFLDSLSLYFEKEAKNPKMTAEMNAFLSKYIKQQMVLFDV